MNLELREVPLIRYHEGMVMENLRNNEWGRQWVQATLMVAQVGVIHCESYLVYNLELR